MVPVVGLRGAVSVTCVWNHCRRGLRVDAGAGRTQKAREGGAAALPLASLEAEGWTK